MVNAAIIAASGGDSPLEVFSGGTSATVLGIVLFIAALSFIYRWTARKVQAPEQTEDTDKAAADAQ